MLGTGGEGRRRRQVRHSERQSQRDKDNFKSSLESKQQSENDFHRVEDSECPAS